MATLRGILSSESGNILVPDVLAELQWKYATVAPFIVFQSKIGRALPATNYEFQHYEADFRRYTSQLSSAVTNAATTIPVNDASGFRVDEVLQIRDGTNTENVRVTAVNYSTNTLTVERGFGTAAAAHNAGTYITSIGDANTEAGSLLLSITEAYTNRTNYTQEFEEPIQFTLRDLKVKKYGGDEFENRVKAAQRDILGRIDRSFARGVKHKTGSGSDLRTTTGGLYDMLRGTSNISYGNGAAPSMNAFYDGIQKAMENGADPSSCVIIAGYKWIRFFQDQAVSNHLRLSPDDRTFGIRVERILTAWGDFPLVSHQALSSLNNWHGDMYFVDFSSVIRREITPLGLFKDVEIAPKVKSHMYYADLGWQFINPLKNFIWQDYTG